MFLIGLAIFLLGLGFLVIMLGGNVADFLDIPSLMIIIFALIGVLTATRSFKLFYAGFRAVIFPKSGITKEMRIRAIALFRLMSKTSMAASIISVFICLTNMLYNLDFSDAGGVASLGINIGASFTLIIYGLLINVAVFEPMVFILKKRRDTEH